jgi:membrane-associated protease RseP (regulator of RpoE activity)
MTTCQACSSEITAPDRFCRNCGAPVAVSITDSVDTNRFNPSNSTPPSAIGGSRELTDQFYTPPSIAASGTQRSGALYQTGSILRKLAHRKLVWLGIILLLVVLIPVGLSIGREVVRANRAERYERIRQVQEDRKARELREAEISQRRSGLAIQNALGFVPAEVSPVEYPDVAGVFVASLTSDYSPAASAQIQAGDVLIELGDQAVRNSGDARRVLEGLRPGSEVPLKLYRDGETILARIRIADRSVTPFEPKIEPRDQGFLGIGDASRRCCIPGVKKWGLEVRRIIDNSPADLAGLQLGDLIAEFDKQATLTPEEFGRRIRAATPRSKVKLKFYRGNIEQTVELILGHGWGVKDEHPPLFSDTRR